MKVKELIEKLEELNNPEAEITIMYEDGVPCKISKVMWEHIINDSYYILLPEN